MRLRLHAAYPCGGETLYVVERPPSVVPSALIGQVITIEGEPHRVRRALPDKHGSLILATDRVPQRKRWAYDPEIE